MNVGLSDLSDVHSLLHFSFIFKLKIVIFNDRSLFLSKYSLNRLNDTFVLNIEFEIIILSAHPFCIFHICYALD